MNTYLDPDTRLKSCISFFAWNEVVIWGRLSFRGERISWHLNSGTESQPLRHRAKARGAISAGIPREQKPLNTMSELASAPACSRPFPNQIDAQGSSGELHWPQQDESRSCGSGEEGAVGARNPREGRELGLHLSCLQGASCWRI